MLRLIKVDLEQVLYRLISSDYLAALADPKSPEKYVHMIQRSILITVSDVIDTKYRQIFVHSDQCWYNYNIDHI